MSSPAPPPSQTQPPLLPTLYALLPPSQFPEISSRISLLSLHAEHHRQRDYVYVNGASVLPSQKRMLRLRVDHTGERVGVRGKKRAKGDGEGGGDGGDGERDGAMSLTYISQPLSGREHDGVSVRAVVEVDVGGMSLLEDVEDFIQTLGFDFSHSYTRTGLLFHLPLPHPTLTLHISISKLRLPSDRPSPDNSSGASAEANTDTDEPYLVQLFPSRPIPSVPTRGEIGLADVVELMRGMAGRIDGLEWGTGR